MTGNGANGQTSQSGDRSQSAETTEAELITLETIKDFSNSQFEAPLIGNLAGQPSKRKETASKIDALVGSNQGVFVDIEIFEVIEATDYDIAPDDLPDNKNIDR